MDSTRIVLHPRTREKLRRKAQRCKDARLKTRYLIVLRSAEGWSGRRTAAALGCSPSHVSRTLARWRELGEAGLVDRREDNRRAKADEPYVGMVRRGRGGTPQGLLRRRPTRTQRTRIAT